MGTRLVAVGKFSPREFRLKSAQTSVGSAPTNSLVLDHETVSRRHATLDRRDGAYWISDGGSTNGTFVNGKRLSKASMLCDGDELSFGAIRYVLRTDEPPVIDTRNHDARRRPVARQLIVALPIILIVAAAGYFFIGNFNDLEMASVTDHPTVIATIALAPRGTITPVPAAIATIAPSPTKVIDSSGATDWLAVLNGYRASAHLAPVTDDPAFSNGDFQHARYITKNYHDQISTGAGLSREMHHEDPSKPWFTNEGATAGLASDVDEMWDSSGSAKASWAIDNWMQGPFHRLSLLDPRLHRVGYGSYCEGGACAAALNVHGDSDRRLTRPVPLAEPIKYPPDGATISTNSFTAEWPDPLTSCPGYETPAGFPITLQLGMLVDPGISRYALTTHGGASIEACAFNDSSYANPDSSNQSLGRDVLRNYGAIVIVPRHPLRPGQYGVVITAGDQSYTWSFTVIRP
jgi:uncharacterized protein YkwD